jgi:hypothetical protein
MGWGFGLIRDQKKWQRNIKIRIFHKVSFFEYNFFLEFSRTRHIIVLTRFKGNNITVINHRRNSILNSFKNIVFNLLSTTNYII